MVYGFVNECFRTLFKGFKRNFFFVKINVSISMCWFNIFFIKSYYLKVIKSIQEHLFTFLIHVIPILVVKNNYHRYKWSGNVCHFQIHCTVIFLMAVNLHPERGSTPSTISIYFYLLHKAKLVLGSAVYIMKLNLNQAHPPYITLFLRKRVFLFHVYYTNVYNVLNMFVINHSKNLKLHANWLNYMNL